jgi:hypothetical protein
MLLLSILLVALVDLGNCQQNAYVDPLRSASAYNNCECQCDSYTWLDWYGRVQGNCKR